MANSMAATTLKRAITVLWPAAVLGVITGAFDRESKETADRMGRGYAVREFPFKNTVRRRLIGANYVGEWHALGQGAKRGCRKA